jgi:hypothetical protein
MVFYTPWPNPVDGTPKPITGEGTVVDFSAAVYTRYLIQSSLETETNGKSNFISMWKDCLILSLITLKVLRAVSRPPTTTLQLHRVPALGSPRHGEREG